MEDVVVYTLVFVAVALFGGQIGVQCNRESSVATQHGAPQTSWQEETRSDIHQNSSTSLTPQQPPPFHHTTKTEDSSSRSVWFQHTLVQSFSAQQVYTKSEHLDNYSNLDDDLKLKESVPAEEGQYFAQGHGSTLKASAKSDTYSQQAKQSDETEDTRFETTSAEDIPFPQISESHINAATDLKRARFAKAVLKLQKKFDISEEDLPDARNILLEMQLAVSEDADAALGFEEEEEQEGQEQEQEEDEEDFQAPVFTTQLERTDHGSDLKASASDPDGDMLEEESSLLLHEGFYTVDGPSLERYRRQAQQDPSFSGDGGSGYDVCNVTTGAPCNATQECVAQWESTYLCICAPLYVEDANGNCVVTPEEQKLYLTTPLDVTFDAQLNSKNSQQFKDLQLQSQIAFTDVFRGISGFKALEVLEFRSADNNAATVVVYAVLFRSNVTQAIVNEVALKVVSMEMEAVKDGLVIGSRNLPSTSYTGVFRTFIDSFDNSDDGVFWCAISSIVDGCGADTDCEDRGLRYLCLCSEWTVEIFNTCIHIAIIVGGGVALILSVVCCVIFVAAWKRRKNKVDYMDIAWI